MDYAELDGCLISQDGLEICISLNVSDPDVQEAELIARDIFDFIHSLTESNQIVNSPEPCKDYQCADCDCLDGDDLWN